MNSAIYYGRVQHLRYGETRHSLNYFVPYFLLDLDELPELDRISRMFAANKAAWFSFRDNDHGISTYDGSLRAVFSAILSEAGCAPDAHRFSVLTMPRIFGYVFNPISIIFCYAENDELDAVIYEVNNTFGERMMYVVSVANDTGRLRHRCDKELFVSPFFGLEGVYEFELEQPTDLFNMEICYRVDDEERLRVTFSGRREQFTSANLRKLALYHSAATIKVAVAIRYEALKLWAKRIPLVRHVAAKSQVSVGTEL